MMKEIPRLLSSPAEPLEGAGDAPGGLAREVQTLADVIRDLEDQLDRMLTANEAIAHDLSEERQQRVAVESVVHDLEARIRESQEQVADRENLLAEINHLKQERTRLSSANRELERKLLESEQRGKSQAAQLERLRAAQVDAVEEVQTVEAQFERAMQMVTDERARLGVVTEERDALAGRTKALEKQLARTQEERDALLAEVEESRAALDEIRRSLVDAVVVSGGALSDDAEGSAGARTTGSRVTR